MPDNVGYDPGTGIKVASREVSYSGETAQSQSVGIVLFTGPDDGKTATDVSAAATRDAIIALADRPQSWAEANGVEVTARSVALARGAN